ncbi:hypothetical protein [Streptomyces sp. NPDC091212]|uniref:hypothetical protein n=1 Tax=Streptomyces sp. NPDC091212 TaxID=3155191 RepID=UPI003443314D
MSRALSADWRRRTPAPVCGADQRAVVHTAATGTEEADKIRLLSVLGTENMPR